MSSQKQKPHKKIEFSKIVCVIAFLVFLLLGAWMIWRYYNLTALAIEADSSAMPDAALPIAGITFIFAPILSYLTYQAGLKMNRNKYSIDADGQPFKEKIGGNAQ